MFPLRSGTGGVTTPSTEEVLYQSLTASAMHEIAKQAIIDSGLIMFHQQAAEVYYRQEQGQYIPEHPDGTYNLYTSKEIEELRRDAIDTVMKYHILNPNGAVARLSPLIYALQNGQPLSAEHATDPFLSKVLENQQQYTNNVFQQNIGEIISQITDFNDINLTDEDSDQTVLNSYNSEDHVDVAIFEDGHVQCACNYCEQFFQIHEQAERIDRDNLNPIQQIMLKQYNF